MNFLENLRTLDVFEYLRQFAGMSPVGDQLIVFFAEFAILLFFVALIALFIFHATQGNKENAQILAMSIASVLVSWGVSRMLKLWIHTSRPFEDISIAPLINVDGLISAFPSGHTTMIATAAVILWRFNRLYAIVGLALAFTVGIARVIAGVHWPIDIAGGVVLGTILGWILGRMVKKNEKRGKR